MIEHLYVFGYVPGVGEPTETETGTALPTGPLGEPWVRPVDGGRFGAVVSFVDPSSITGLDDDRERLAAAVLHHDAVLRALIDRPVAPVRFGTMVEDASKLSAATAHHEADLERQLDLLTGRHEYDVRMTVVEEPPADGADYLRRRGMERRGHGRLERLADDVAARVTAAVVRRRHRSGLEMSVLAGADELAALRRHLGPVGGAGLAEASVRGPLPPYSFTFVGRSPTSAGTAHDR